MTGARFCFTEMKREGGEEGDIKKEWRGAARTQVLRYLKRKKRKGYLKNIHPRAPVAMVQNESDLIHIGHQVVTCNSVPSDALSCMA